jgi:hypothetical protein
LSLLLLLLLVVVLLVVCAVLGDGEGGEAEMTVVVCLFVCLFVCFFSLRRFGRGSFAGGSPRERER